MLRVRFHKLMAERHIALHTNTYTHTDAHTHIHLDKQTNTRKHIFTKTFFINIFFLR